MIAPVWGMNGTTKTFTYTKNGQSVVVENPKQVVDVSEHDGKINWEKLKSEGIDGAILRIGWGVGYTDEYFDYNIRNDAQRYGERHESRQVLFRLPNFFDGIYQPWEDCSSAQLLIEVQ